MKIKNVGEVIKKIKPLLSQYLEDSRLRFKTPLFQCPNYKEHQNEDEKPSCGFLPDSNNEKWHCFACGVVGDIFQAVHYLEGKNVTGLGFYKTVKYLADKYNIQYELEEPTEGEKNFEIIQQFLNSLISSAHKYLINNKPKDVISYIKKRKWTKCVKHFQLGYLPKSKKTKEFFIKSFKKYPLLKDYISISYDQVVDRLIYPIKSKHENILGIIHRQIKDSDERNKYQKHLLKTLTKSGTLFNLKDTYKKIYVVEGGSSVLTLYQNGIQNAASLLGSSFSENMYKALVKNNVEEITLCLDGDDAGDKCLENIIKLVQNKSDIKVYIKKLSNNEDPDDIITTKGVKKFKEIPKISLYKYQLNRLKDKDDIKIRESLYSLILSCNDSIIQERMIKLFIKELKIQKTSLLNELKKYEQLHSLSTDLRVADLLLEKEALIKDVEKFDERAWRTDKLLGPSIGFPILDEKLDGLQDGLHLVGGKWNTGKSAYMTSMALNLLKNPNNYVLYFSIDDSILTKTIPRMLANLSCIPINTISNPIWKIQKNETLSEIEKIKVAQKREKAIELFKSLAPQFGLKDASHGYDIEFVEKMIKIHHLIAENKKLIVFIDFMNMIQYHKLYDRTEIETRLAGELKHLSGLYNIPIVTSVEATKNISDTNVRDKDIKGSSAIHHKADTILLLWSDFEDNSQSNMYFYDDEGKAYPIVEIKVAKNKISGFKGSIYYKFFTDYSKFVEISEEDQKKYWRGR